VALHWIAIRNYTNSIYVWHIRLCVAIWLYIVGLFRFNLIFIILPQTLF